MGAHCCGLPFGQEKKRGIWGRAMATYSYHTDWSMYTLPLPAAHEKASVHTCLVVLTLFAAFPELDRVPLQNKGGKVAAASNEKSPIEVGDAGGGFDICAATVEEQIRLRELVTLLQQHSFSTDVQLVQTRQILRRRAVSLTQVSAAVARAGL